MGRSPLINPRKTKEKDKNLKKTKTTEEGSFFLSGAKPPYQPLSHPSFLNVSARNPDYRKNTFYNFQKHKKPKRLKTKTIGKKGFLKHRRRSIPCCIAISRFLAFDAIYFLSFSNSIGSTGHFNFTGRLVG